MTEKSQFTQHLPVVFGTLACLCLTGSLVLGFRRTLKKVNTQLLREAKTNSSPVVQYTARELLNAKPTGSDTPLWMFGAKAFAIGAGIALAGTASLVYIASYTLGATNQTELSKKLQEKMPQLFTSLKTTVESPVEKLHGNAAESEADTIRRELRDSFSKTKKKEYVITAREQREIDQIIAFFGLLTESETSTSETPDKKKEI